MPWMETDPMLQRIQFIHAYKSGLYTMTELCQRFQISRKTGYKWVHRFNAEGLDGLQDRSRAPHNIPHKTSEEVTKEILQMREARPTWGPKKLSARLQKQKPETLYPAKSTIGDILDRHGLVPRRKLRIKSQHHKPPIVEMDAPNQVWCVDFKGEFLLDNSKKEYCYPLTVTDGYSRYILGCKALASTCFELTIPIFEKLFAAYGLPEAILSDNGVPFATGAIHGFSQLNVWWFKLGIRHETIVPGNPQQNGRHERMHRTLKQETANPPRKSFNLQERAFREFAWEFNHIRPHEAIDFKTPSELYTPSTKPYPETLSPPSYPSFYEARRVSNSGCIRIKSVAIFISKTLAQEIVGVYEEQPGIWSVYFYNFLLGRTKLEHRRLIV